MYRVYGSDVAMSLWMGKLKRIDSERGFSLIELLLVILISSIMMGGVVGMFTMAFNHFDTHKSLQAVNDSSRRMLNTMSRQLRDALHFENLSCTASGIGFWADIDNDNPSATVSNYVNAEYITWTSSATSVVQGTTQQVGDPENPGSSSALMSSANIGSGLEPTDGLKFEYYRRGATSATPPTQLNVNKDAGKIRISLKMKKGNVSRTYYQDVYLRVDDRTPVGTYCTIASVVPGSFQAGHIPYTGVVITGNGTHFTQADSVGRADTIGILVSSINVWDETHCDATITVYASCTTGAHSIWVRTGTEDPEPYNITVTAP